MNTHYLSPSLRLIIIAAFLLIYIQGCKPDSEEVVPSPQITRLLPESGLAGSTLSISGKGFSTEATGNVVKMNGVKANIQQVLGDTLIRALVPENATSGLVQVAVGKQLVNGPLFIVTRNPNPPVLTSVMPTSVDIGDVITIKGSNFKTGPELNQNTVRVSGLKVEIISGNETELKVRVPGVPKQPTVPVTVSVLGTLSNELPVQVNGFDGKLVWLSVTASPNEKRKNTVYRVIANADGSSLKRDERALPAEQQATFGFQRGNLSIYNRKDNSIYFYSGFDEDIWKVDYSFTNFSRIYKLNLLYNNGYNPYYEFYDMIPSLTHNGFYLRNYQLKPGNQPGGGFTLFEGVYDGSETLLDKFKLLSPPGPYSNSPDPGANTILVGNLIFSFDNTAPKVIDIAPDDLGAFIDEEYCYNPEDGNYYFFARSSSSSLAGIFRVSKSGGKAQKLIDIDARSELYPRYLQALTTPAGTKLFWLLGKTKFSTSKKITGIYYANLNKGEAPYTPVLLYAKPSEIQSDEGTRRLDGLDGDDYNTITMFYVIPN